MACFGKDYDEALLKSILSANNNFDFNKKAVLLSLGGTVNKAKFLEAAEELQGLGYTIYGTETTAEFFNGQGVACTIVGKATESSPNVIDIVDGKKIAFVVNLSMPETKLETSETKQHGTDGIRIRRATVDNQIPLFTDLHLARAFVKSLARYKIDDLEIKSYKEYLD